jgi:tRNA G26 N,N-dimethylase Trm1
VAELFRDIPDGFSSVTEGKATILQQGNSVFYNKAQVVNRDLSIAVLKWLIRTRVNETAKSKRKGHIKPPPSNSPYKVGRPTLLHSTVAA